MSRRTGFGQMGTRRSRYTRLAGIALLMLCIVGCTSRDADTGAGNETTVALSEESQASATDSTTGSGRDLVIAVPNLGTDGLIDPILSLLDDKPYTRLMYTSLFDTDLTDTELSEETGLAESWEWSEDGTSLHVKLREGVLFHNGDEMTAQDVAFSLERLADPENIQPYAGVILDVLDDVEVINDYELTLHLNEPSLDFQLVLSPLGGGAEGYVVPKAYFEEVGASGFRAEPVGTGPYRLVRHEPGSTLEFEAHANYFLGTPSIDRIRIEAVPELRTRLAMLQTGDADAALISLDTAAEAQASGLVIHSKRGGEVVSIAPQLWGDPTDPLTDQAVREALFKAINYEEINEFLLAGQGILTGDYTFGGLGSEPLSPYPYDPEAAEALLRDAGYGPGDIEITMYVALKSAVPELQDIAQAIVDYWSAVGVATTEVVAQEWGTLRPEVIAQNLETPSMRMLSIADRPTWGPVLELNFPGPGCPLALREGSEPSSGPWANCPPGDFADITYQLGQAKTLEEVAELQFEAAKAMYDTYSNSVIAVVPPVFATSEEYSDWDLGQTPYDFNFKYLGLNHLDK